MVFEGKLDQYMDRYSTRDQAIQGHRDIVKRVKRAERWSLVSWMWRFVWFVVGEPKPKMRRNFVWKNKP